LNLSEQDVMCSADLRAHSPEVAEFLKKGDPGTFPNMDAEAAATWLKQEPGNCIVRTSLAHSSSAKIIAWSFAPAARVKAALRAVGATALVVLVFMVGVLNLYYRGLVYIVFGGRRAVSSSGQDAP